MIDPQAKNRNKLVSRLKDKLSKHEPNLSYLDASDVLTYLGNVDSEATVEYDTVKVTPTLVVRRTYTTQSGVKLAYVEWYDQSGKLEYDYIDYNVDAAMTQIAAGDTIDMSIMPEFFEAIEEFLGKRDKYIEIHLLIDEINAVKTKIAEKLGKGI